MDCGQLMLPTVDANNLLTPTSGDIRSAFRFLFWRNPTEFPSYSVGALTPRQKCRHSRRRGILLPYSFASCNVFTLELFQVLWTIQGPQHQDCAGHRCWAGRHYSRRPRQVILPLKTKQSRLSEHFPETTCTHPEQSQLRVNIEKICNATVVYKRPVENRSMRANHHYNSTGSPSALIFFARCLSGCDETRARTLLAYFQGPLCHISPFPKMNIISARWPSGC